MEESNRNHQRRKDLDFAHVMPQAPDMEKAVLGALMIDKDAYLEVCDLLRPESFYEPRNQMVYEAIQQLSMEESPVDVLTVVDKLEKTGNLNEVGGPGYIAELSSMVVDIKDVIQEADSLLLEISQKSVKKDYSVLAPIVNQAVKIVEAAYANKGGLTGISTGFYKLDDMTCGWQKSDLVIIAGRPAMGKTAFALSLAKNIAVDQKIPMAFFSLEMTSVQLANRLMANNCQIEGHKLLSGQLKRDDWDRLDKHLNSLLEAPLYIDDTEGIPVMELRTKIRRLVKEHHIELVMVDYLQLMTASGMRYNNRQEEISLISRALKGMAKEFNIPIIALSQLNRGVDTREGPEGKRPRLSDLRESGAIEQDADMVIFLHRPEYYGLPQSEDGSIDYRGKAEVIISKHRKGAVGIIMMDFKGEYTRFENPEDNRIGHRPPTDGGEIIGSSMNDMPFPPPTDYNPFNDKA